MKNNLIILLLGLLLPISLELQAQTDTVRHQSLKMPGPGGYDSVIMSLRFPDSAIDSYLVFYNNVFAKKLLRAEVEDRDKMNRGVQCFIVLFAALLLIVIWWYYITSIEPLTSAKDKLDDDGKDHGVLLLAMALVWWAMQGYLDILGFHLEQTETVTTYIFSGASNASFLAALPFFEHGLIQSRNRRRTWEMAVLLIFLFTVGFCLLFYQLGEKFAADALDMIFSITTLILLAYHLEKTFRARRMAVFARLAWSVMFFVLISQVILYLRDLEKGKGLDQYFHDIIWDQVLYTVSQSALCSLLVALAFSWVIEKSRIVSFARTLEAVRKDEKTLVVDVNDPEKTIRDIRDLVEKDHLRSALRALKEYFQRQSDSEEELNMLALLSNRHRAALRNLSLGFIPWDSYNMERTHVGSGLLQLLNDAMAALRQQIKTQGNNEV